MQHSTQLPTAPTKRAARGQWRACTAVLVAVCGLLAVGCASTKSTTTSSTVNSSKRDAAKSHSPVAPNGQPIGHLSTPGTPKGEQTVSIAVVAIPGLTARAAMALVPVTIDGQGPFPFALDTGASRSLIALPLAQRLHLSIQGKAGTLYGIGGPSTAQNVAITSWRAGQVSLPSEVIAAVPSKTATPQGPKAGNTHKVSGPVGLLGSDVLSRYGKIAIDYDKGLLILDPPVK